MWWRSDRRKVTGGMVGVTKEKQVSIVAAYASEAVWTPVISEEVKKNKTNGNPKGRDIGLPLRAQTAITARRVFSASPAGSPSRFQAQMRFSPVRARSGTSEPLAHLTQHCPKPAKEYTGSRIYGRPVSVDRGSCPSPAGSPVRRRMSDHSWP
jgi:hypothetical protein